MVVQLCHSVVYRQLFHIEVFNARGIIERKRYGTPYSACGQTDAPVPTIAVGSLAGVNADALLAVVVVCRIGESVCFPLRKRLLDGGVEIDGKVVIPLAEEILYLKVIAHKHIVGAFQQGAVQIDIGVCVQSFKTEHGGTMSQLCFCDGESGSVFPVFFLHPLYLLFVHAEEGIDELAIVYEVLVYGSTHFCRHPFVLVCLGELPVLVQLQAQWLL